MNKYFFKLKNFLYSGLLSDEQGSMIIIVLMLLTIMSIIGIASTTTTITENFIVRNDSIRKQNIQLGDAVAAEALQRVLDAGLVDSANPNTFLLENDVNPASVPLLWVNEQTVWNWAAWYNTTNGRVLNATNSEVPASVEENTGNGVAALLEERGEWDPGNPDVDDCPIRYALVGWDIVPGSSLKMTSATRRSAMVLAEYFSERFGVIRLTVGMERDFL